MRILACLLLLLASCEKAPPPKTLPTPKVSVAKAKEKSVPYVIRAIGQAQANNVVDIVPQVTGMLVGAYFESGDYVEEGDLLFTIDPRVYEAQLGEAQGQLKQAQASLEYDISQVERYKQLLPEDFVSELQFQQYLADMETAAGEVVQYEAAVDKGKVELDFCIIRAPMRGKLGHRITDPGNIVDPDMNPPMVVLNQITPALVYVSVPERYLPLLRKYERPGGLPAYFKPTGEDVEVEGRLNFINNEIDKATGILTVRATVDNEDELIWPGQYCETTIHLYEIPDAVVIPYEAVGWDTQGAYVFVVGEEDKVETRRVELGQLFDNDQVISKGLKAGEVVVTEGKMALRPGIKVAVANPPKDEVSA